MLLDEASMSKVNVNKTAISSVAIWQEHTPANCLISG